MHRLHFLHSLLPDNSMCLVNSIHHGLLEGKGNWTLSLQPAWKVQQVREDSFWDIIQEALSDGVTRLNARHWGRPPSQERKELPQGLLEASSLCLGNAEPVIRTLIPKQG